MPPTYSSSVLPRCIGASCFVGFGPLGFGKLLKPRPFSTSSLPSAIGYEEYLLDYSLRVSDTLHFIGRWRYDARKKRLNEQSYGIMQRLGQTWDVRYELSFSEGQQRESSFGFNIEIELLKF